MWAMSRSVRTANESITSSAVTSTITPRVRNRPTRSISASRSCERSASVSADWMDAIREWPCFRIGTSTRPPSPEWGVDSRLRSHVFLRDDLVAEQAFRLLDATLQVAHGRHLAQIHADRHQRLRDLRREAGHDDRRTQQTRSLDRLHEMVRHVRVHRRDAGDVDDDHLRAVGADGAQQLLRELSRALRVDDADDRQNQQSLAHLQHRGGQLPDGLLLLPDDPLALLHEADGDRIRDAVCRRLVGIEDAVELVEVSVVLAEQRAGEHVTQQQYDADDFVRLDASRDDALGEIARVRLQRLERS